MERWRMRKLVTYRGDFLQNEVYAERDLLINVNQNKNGSLEPCSESVLQMNIILYVQCFDYYHSNWVSYL